MVLKQGVDAELLGIPGAPMFDKHGKIMDPLAHCMLKYIRLHFVGKEGEEVTKEVVLQKNIWFDGEVLNK